MALYKDAKNKPTNQRFKKMTNTLGETTVFDRKLQRTVAGTFKAKGKQYAYANKNRKIVLMNPFGSDTKKSALAQVNKYIKTLK